jgi:bacteriorhodopsin
MDIAQKIYFVKETFLFSCIFLFGTTLITFIESMKTDTIKARHILNVETAVSLIAGYVYSIFVTMTQREDFSLRHITQIRYMDWVITTPFLLLGLILFFTFYSKNPVSFRKFFVVILCNYLMLLFGYLGETDRMNKMLGGVLGFIAYALMLYFLYSYFVHNDHFRHKRKVFIVFAIIWSFYGIAYYLSDEDKNILYNFLDVISKSGFGLFMWLYYGRVFA